MNSRAATIELEPDALGPEGAAARRERGGAMKFQYASASRPLDGFVIKRGIGRGGFGEVYFATSDACACTTVITRPFPGMRRSFRDNPTAKVDLGTVFVDSKDTDEVPEQKQASCRPSLEGFPLGGLALRGPRLRG